MKQRAKMQCKKTECKYYESYKKWSCGDSNLNYCMNCKNSHVSQFVNKNKDR